MRKVKLLCLFAIVAVAVAGWAVVASDGPAGDEKAAAAPSGDSDAAIVEKFLAPVTPAGKGGGPKGGGCCDPALEPGTNGNPFCFEGHTCCSDGQWRCNNPDATPSCAAGEVCAPGCGSRGDSCESGDDCCSGSCKGGRCK